MDRTASALSHSLAGGPLSPTHRVLGRYENGEDRIERARARDVRERDRDLALLAPAREYERNAEWTRAHERDLAHAQEWTVNAIARAEADRERAEAAAMALSVGDRDHEAGFDGRRRESRGRIESWQDGVEVSRKVTHRQASG